VCGNDVYLAKLATEVSFHYAVTPPKQVIDRDLLCQLPYLSGGSAVFVFQWLPRVRSPKTATLQAVQKRA